LEEGKAEELVELIRDLVPNPVLASAFTGQGLGVLEECISQRLQPLQEYQLRLPYTAQGLSELSRLYETTELLAVSYEEELIVRLRGREETVARAGLSGARRL
ncbi:MAG: GTPase HflX, partial [Methanothrix sp.]